MTGSAREYKTLDNSTPDQKIKSVNGKNAMAAWPLLQCVIRRQWSPSERVYVKIHRRSDHN